MGLFNADDVRNLLSRWGLSKEIPAEDLCRDMNFQAKKNAKTVYQPDFKNKESSYWEDKRWDHKKYKKRGYIFDEEEIQDDTAEYLLYKIVELLDLPQDAFASPYERANLIDRFKDRSKDLFKRIDYRPPEEFN